MVDTIAPLHLHTLWNGLVTASVLGVVLSGFFWVSVLLATLLGYLDWQYLDPVELTLSLGSSVPASLVDSSSGGCDAINGGNSLERRRKNDNI
ncbi:hypothetical protein [Natronococcus pandeyae]|uniref:hypothetical protein n=1 Tax=Natronococcus pandeyae TaxID=2055836 RepID=UPI0011E8359A|nr:hypothetical protein [Natronococcus pandeyae]